MVTHQGLHGAVKSVPVVTAELGVAATEVGITVGLGLLDTVARGLDAVRVYGFGGDGAGVSVRCTAMRCIRRKGLGEGCLPCFLVSKRHQ